MRRKRQDRPNEGGTIDLPNKPVVTPDWVTFKNLVGKGKLLEPATPDEAATVIFQVMVMVGQVLESRPEIMQERIIRNLFPVLLDELVKVTRKAHKRVIDNPKDDSQR